MSESAGQDNYVTPDNLLARIAIHRYATDPGWMSWLFDREMPDRHDAARILDLGCGTAVLWTDNRERIGSAWELTLADSSPGMIDAAHRGLGDLAVYAIADAQTLPFADGAFDVALANHMLYHVPDRPSALAEIRRVLRPGGRFHCSTNGRGHLAQLAALLPDPVAISIHDEAFGLETGPPQLQRLFTQVSVARFKSSLRVPAAEPVLAYITSSERSSQDADLDRARRIVEAEIQQTGAFSIDTYPGVISCCRP